MSKPRGINGKVFDYDPRLKRLHEYVEQSYSEPISLGKAASVAALESSYFSSYFHAKIGITFTDWLRQLRISKAMELMKANDFSISEVAEAVGFKDLRTFERAFKRYALKTPREFKKSVLPGLTERLLQTRKAPALSSRKRGGGKRLNVLEI